MAGDSDPIALGQAVFRSATPACIARHSTAPGVNMAGPTPAGIVSRAQETLASAQYKGRAKDVAGYIVAPSAHLASGAMYLGGDQSFMHATYANDLTPAQIEQLLAYLSSFK